MKADIVCDIGNTRIKWGRCAGREIARIASLPDDPARWEQELAAWRPTASPWTWALASVQPARAERLSEWLLGRGETVVRLHKAAQLPLLVGLEAPDKAGIDRLLDAVAAKRRLEPGRAAVLIDAGSAVTADYLDEEQVFRGGAIFPGLDLMAEALHRYTALLPKIEVALPLPEAPAGATVPAMQLGTYLAVSGGIREAIRLYSLRSKRPARVFFTGGQGHLLAEAMDARGAWPDCVVWPEQTLIGVLDSVEAMS